MIDLKNVETDFEPTDAFNVLNTIVSICGIDSVMAALDEIAAQQSVQRIGGTSCNCTLHPTEETSHLVSCPANPANR